MNTTRDIAVAQLTLSFCFLLAYAAVFAMFLDREYRVLDPRARWVKRFARELAPGTPLENTTATLEAIEARFTERMRAKGKPLHANLEFYKGIVYAAAGFPPDFFTATFAQARVFGYVAHFMESRRDNRIIRPSARYVDVMPPRN